MSVYNALLTGSTREDWFCPFPSPGIYGQQRFGNLAYSRCDLERRSPLLIHDLVTRLAELSAEPIHVAVLLICEHWPATLGTSCNATLPCQGWCEQFRMRSLRVLLRRPVINLCREVQMIQTSGYSKHRPHTVADYAEPKLVDPMRSSWLAFPGLFSVSLVYYVSFPSIDPFQYGEM